MVNRRILLTASVTLALSLLVPVPAHAAWTGDAGRIYFTCKVTGETQNDICSVKPDGSDLLNLTRKSATDESQATVSRDGSTVAFVRGTTLAEQRVWVMDANGSNQRQLTTMPSGGPAFTPDGRVSFRAQTGTTPTGEGIYEFLIVPVSGGTPTHLAPASGTHRPPRWTSSGAYEYSKFMPIPGTTDSSEQIFVVVAGQESQVTFPQQGLLSNAFGELSPDAKTVYYFRKDAVYKAPAVAGGGASEVQLTPTPPPGQSGKSFRAPSPSPDGTRLVVQNNQAPSPTSLYTLKTDGSELTPLPLSGVVSASFPYWAPAASGVPPQPSPTINATAPSKLGYTKTLPVKLTARHASYNVTVTATVTVPAHKKVKKKTFKFPAKQVVVHDGKTVTVKLTLSKTMKKAVKPALKAGKKPVLKVKVTGSHDGAAVSPIATFTVKLTK